MSCLLVSDSELHIYTRIDRHGGDVLNNTERRVQVNDALVDLHFETVPSLGTLTIRSLSGGDLEGLGRHTDGTLNVEVLLLSTGDQIVRDYKGSIDGRYKCCIIDVPFSSALTFLLDRVMRMRRSLSSSSPF